MLARRIIGFLHGLRQQEEEQQARCQLERKRRVHRAIERRTEQSGLQMVFMIGKSKSKSNLMRRRKRMQIDPRDDLSCLGRVDERVESFDRFFFFP